MAPQPSVKLQVRLHLTIFSLLQFRGNYFYLLFERIKWQRNHVLYLFKLFIQFHKTFLKLEPLHAFKLNLSVCKMLRVQIIFIFVNIKVLMQSKSEMVSLYHSLSSVRMTLRMTLRMTQSPSVPGASLIINSVFIAVQGRYSNTVVVL